MLTAQDRVKRFRRSLYMRMDMEVFEKKYFRLPVIESKPAILWDVTPYIHVNLVLAIVVQGQILNWCPRTVHSRIRFY
jgi:hypothetical protein